MQHALGIGRGVYAAICAAVPLLWGLAVYWTLRYLPAGRRSEGSPPDRQDEADTTSEDFRI